MTTDLTEYQLRLLRSNLKADRISKRSQGGRQLSYLEAYDVKATLIRIFGYGGFSSEVVREDIVRFETDIPKKDGGTTAFRVTAMATMRLTIHQTGAVYSESAVASQAGADPGEVADFAVKTAESDALKRCAINLGTQFGLSLYNDGDVKDVVKATFAPDQEWNIPAAWKEDVKPVNPEGQALVERALKMKAEKEAADVPMALDPTLDPAES